MSVVGFTGWETTATGTNSNCEPMDDGAAESGNSILHVRTGVSSLRANVASGGNFSVGITLLSANYCHFGLYIAALPTVGRTFFGTTAANTVNLLLNTDGTIAVRNNTTVVGTSGTALSTGTWYWIGVKNIASGTGVLLQIDGVDQVSGTNGSVVVAILGMNGSEASALDLSFDDLIIDNAGFLAPSKVALCLPISDNSVGSGWTNDAAGTTNLWDAVNSTPPIGIADTSTGTGLNQIRNAANNTNAYAANLTTYASAGVNTGDTVIACVAMMSTAAPSATSPKSGSITLSNPTVTKTSFTNFYNGSSIAGTYATGWRSNGTANLIKTPIQTSPTVTIASSPILTVTQDTGSTRVAMCCFMAMYVAWTPAAVVAGNPAKTSTYPPILAQ